MENLENTETTEKEVIDTPKRGRKSKDTMEVIEDSKVYEKKSIEKTFYEGKELTEIELNALKLKAKLKETTKANLVECGIVKGSKKIVMFDTKSMKPYQTTADKLELNKYTSGMVWMQLTDGNVEVGSNPEAVPVSDIPVSAFKFIVNTKLTQPTKTGRQAFQLPANDNEAVIEAYRILKKCTENEAKDNGRFFTKKAKEFVKAHFELSTDLEATAKCNELYIISFGNRYGRVDDILHIPDFDGELEISPYVAIQPETVSKPMLKVAIED